MDKYTAIILAAGIGRRMKTKIPKPYLAIHKTPVIALTIKTFNNCTKISDIVIVTHQNWIDYCKEEIVKKYKFHKVHTIVKGGIERQDSVNAGLPFVHTNFVFIHDAVRPFINQKLINSIIKAGKEDDAVIPGLPVRNTIKRVYNGKVKETLVRDGLYEIQTPQLFNTNLLKKAYKKAYIEGTYATDDASLMERIGVKVKVVKGVTYNIKITTQEDMKLGFNCNK